MSKTNNNKKKNNQKEIISKFDFINDSFSITKTIYVYNENLNLLYLSYDSSKNSL